ncbi:cytochrome b/b6 domain-containing protein [Rhodoferax ferrireducens]|uniref:cytochrome b/b6 domain-containing protein n=1 Tax=Rhodoferax ferrireducens TaxID=192843 RepID=UPI000E0D5C4D|nr:cytochrome b/b6 domain-containing protein [Rhodoferax ferrireducens]
MTESTAKTKILVWDAPVRVFHWLMVLSFAGAYLTAESERWRLVHVTLGYTLGGLVAFRILWGLMGTRHARFVSFVRGPAAVIRYVRAMLAGEPGHHVGHNPAGALAIVLLLLSSIAIVTTGWAVYNDVGGDWLGDLHEGAANFMLFVVAVHVAGVAVASWLHRENLVRAMVTGKKEGTPDTGIRRAWRPLALVMLVAVLGFWWLQWQSAPPPQTSGGEMMSDKTQYSSRGHDDGD